jgi:type 1 fimbria pilin
MNLHMLGKIAVPLILSAVAAAAAASNGNPVTVKGYVLDSACAFTKNLDKPISADCARACARAGSPLVILADDGTVYWPIADTTPATGQNDKLIKFAGQKVTATGKLFQRGGSSALVVEKIELPLASSK